MGSGKNRVRRRDPDDEEIRTRGLTKRNDVDHVEPCRGRYQGMTGLLLHTRTRSSGPGHTIRVGRDKVDVGGRDLVPE